MSDQIDYLIKQAVHCAEQSDIKNDDPYAAVSIAHSLAAIAVVLKEIRDHLQARPW